MKGHPEDRIGYAALSFVLIAYTVVLALQLPHGYLPAEPTDRGDTFQYLIRAVLVLVIISLPFDLLAIRHFLKQTGADEDQRSSHYRTWMRGVMLHALGLIGFGMLYLWVGSAFGVPGVLAVLLGVFAVLLVFQNLALLAVGRMRKIHDRSGSFQKAVEESDLQADQVEVVASTDPAFTGGAAGLPGAEKVIVPHDAAMRDSPSGARHILTGAQTAIRERTRLMPMLSVILVVTAISGISSQLPGAGVVTVAGIVSAGLWFTVIFSLVWIAVSRWARAEVDTSGGQVSAETRRFGPTGTYAPVSHARGLGLYLSWACLNFASRLPPEVIGRPELYVMPPHRTED